LKTVEEGFQKLLLRPEYRDLIRIFTFYEEAAVTGVRFIVPKDSAQLKQYPSQSIHANHMDMTKFSSDAGPGYVAVCAQLQGDSGKLDGGGPAGSSESTSSNPHPETTTQGAGTASNTYNVNMHSHGGPQFQVAMFLAIPLGEMSLANDGHVTLIHSIF
jgi:hypothetical protein